MLTPQLLSSDTSQSSIDAASIGVRSASSIDPETLLIPKKDKSSKSKKLQKSDNEVLAHAGHELEHELKHPSEINPESVENTEEFMLPAAALPYRVIFEVVELIKVFNDNCSKSTPNAREILSALITTDPQTVPALQIFLSKIMAFKAKLLEVTWNYTWFVNHSSEYYYFKGDT